ncbi:MAG: ATP-binding cassette domain-containing protein [Rickettsiales bacterium]
MYNNESGCITKTDVAQYHGVYSLITPMQQFLTPLSLGAAGCVTGLGAHLSYRQCSTNFVLGFGAAVFDDFYSQIHFLSSSFIGYSYANIMSSQIKGISGAGNIAMSFTGAAVGGVFAIGIPQENYESLDAVIGYSILAMHETPSLPAALIEGTTSAYFDAYTDTAYMKSFMISNFLVSKAFLLGSHLVGGSNQNVGHETQLLLSASISLVSVDYLDHLVTFNFTALSKAYLNLYQVYSEYIPENQVSELMHGQMVASLASGVTSSFSKIHIAHSSIDIIKNIVSSDKSYDQKSSLIKIDLLKIGAFASLSALSNYLYTTEYNFFNDQIIYQVEDRVTQNWLCNSNPLIAKHLNFSSFEFLEGRFRGDIFVLTNFNTKTFKSGLDSLFRSLSFSSFAIGNNVEDIITSNLIFSKILSVPDLVLGNKIGYLNAIRRDYITNSTIVQKDVYSNAEAILQTGGLKYVHNQWDEIQTLIRNVTVEKIQYGIIRDSYREVSSQILKYLPWVAIFISSQENELFLNEKDTINAGYSDISRLFSWSDVSSDQLKEMQYCSDSLSDLAAILKGIEKIDNEGLLLEQKNSSCINIETKITFLKNGNGLLEVNDFQLCPGNVYAITGESGSGKTTLFNHVIGVNEGHFHSDGKLSGNFSCEPKFFVSPQKDYFPKLSSLFESIIYPVELSSLTDEDRLSKEGRVKSLLSHFGFPEEIIFDINAKKDWQEVLSGGQAKILMLIRAIMYNAEVNVFDEIFNGIDSMTSVLLRSTIKEYLGDSSVVIIDHNYEANNVDSFYDEHYVVENGALNLSLE